MTRYVIARQERGEFLAGPVVPVLDLPDAEHVHLTRRADGGWDAVPASVLASLHTGDGVTTAWVDAPVQGDDRD